VAKTVGRVKIVKTKASGNGDGIANAWSADLYISIMDLTKMAAVFEQNAWPRK
jgi:hypothetical protein